VLHHEPEIRTAGLVHGRNNSGSTAVGSRTDYAPS